MQKVRKISAIRIDANRFGCESRTMIFEPQGAGEVTWRENAACLPHPATLFFGFDDSEPPVERRAREEQAKVICTTCQVKEECLGYALQANETYGIWGGLTEVELKARRRSIRAGGDSRF